MYPERVLIVDDDPLVPSIARAHFIAGGVRICDTASDGEQALQTIQAGATPYDLIVCDISMPKVDGIQLIAGLHGLGYKNALGIITSQHPTLARTALNIAQSYGMQPAGFGRKPLERQILDRMLRNVREAHARVRPARNLVAMLSATDLQQAMDEDRLVPFYQPIVELHSGKVTGAEALARIMAGDGSIISPAA
jgi:CheY-like chemotaxis protein